jgi:hypothetical protein
LLDDAWFIELLYVLSQIGFTKSSATESPERAISSQHQQWNSTARAKLCVIRTGRILAIGIEAADHNWHKMGSYIYSDCFEICG